MTLEAGMLYFLAAAAGGAMNSVAGGGTFLVFPFLIMNGLGALEANIMSTMALWPGSVSSAWAYRSRLNTPKGHLIQFMVISIVGSAIGTLILLKTPEATFAHLVPWLLLVATLIFTFGRRIKFSMEGRATGMLLQFIIAIYGGYFGAGIGILMLAMLQIMGFTDIHSMNAMKSTLGSTINAVAFILFIVSGRVIWPLAVVMIAGAIVGGYFGARMALKVSPHKVRWMVSVIGFAMTAYFFIHGA